MLSLASHESKFRNFRYYRSRAVETAADRRQWIHRWLLHTFSRLHWATDDPGKWLTMTQVWRSRHTEASSDTAHSTSSTPLVTLWWFPLFRPTTACATSFALARLYRDPTGLDYSISVGSCIVRLESASAHAVRLFAFSRSGYLLGYFPTFWVWSLWGPWWITWYILRQVLCRTVMNCDALDC